MNQPLPFAATTPLSIGRVGLRARDAGRLAAWYAATLGLEELARDGSSTTLGAAGRPLLVLEADAAAARDDPHGAGLFHTAFLLPSRADLGRWVRHAAERQLGIDGASDHLVSEAIYLSDPEGNGIEIYADRPREAWPRRDGAIVMATERLDLRALAEAVPADAPAWTGAPEGTVVGHVHLRVGDPAEAERWWRQEVGMEVMARYGGQATFLASGGYHHHIGANAWQSRGAGLREEGRAGLAWVELASHDARDVTEKRDPWGTVIRGVPAV